MDSSKLIRCCLILQIAVCALYTADAACTIPDTFRNTSWIDSMKGDINFTTWKMEWTFEVNTKVVREWEIADDTKFETEGYVAYRSLNTFKVAGQTYYSFLCLRYEQLSAYVYKYFTLHDVSNLTDGERVLASKTEGLWRFSDICNLSYVVDRSIFNLMISPGKESEFSVECPKSILGNFKSSVYLPNGTIPCGGSDLTLDTCTDKASLQLNSTDCRFPVAYSANGSLSCLTSEKIGSYYYSYMYNHDDTVDNNSTFRISCMVTDENGEHISIAPMRCQPGQTPFHYPQDHRGNKIGMLIRNSENFRCNGDENKDDKEEKLIIILIVVLAPSVIFIIVFVVACIRIYRKRKRSLSDRPKYCRLEKS